MNFIITFQSKMKENPILRTTIGAFKMRNGFDYIRYCSQMKTPHEQQKPNKKNKRTKKVILKNATCH